MTPLQEAMRDELLHQFPDWGDPGRVLPRRRRPPSRGPWLLPAALAVAVLLMLVPSVLKPSAVTTLAPRVERLAWPKGFTAASGLSLGQGRLVMFSGRRVRSYVAGRLGRLAWALELPRSTRVLAAAAGAYGGAAVVARQPGAVVLLVVSARGRIVGQHRLWPVQQAQVPAPRVLTLRVATAGWWIASDRTSTWIVNDGAAGVVGPLAGGSGALALASGAAGDPWNVAAWIPLHRAPGALYASGAPPAPWWNTITHPRRSGVCPHSRGHARFHPAGVQQVSGDAPDQPVRLSHPSRAGERRASGARAAAVG